MELVEIIFKNEYYLHILLWFEKLIDFFRGVEGVRGGVEFIELVELVERFLHILLWFEKLIDFFQWV